MLDDDGDGQLQGEGQGEGQHEQHEGDNLHLEPDPPAGARRDRPQRDRKPVVRDQLSAAEFAALTARVAATVKATEFRFLDEAAPASTAHHDYTADAAASAIVGLPAGPSDEPVLELAALPGAAMSAGLHKFHNFSRGRPAGLLGVNIERKFAAMVTSAPLINLGAGFVSAPVLAGGCGPTLLVSVISAVRGTRPADGDEQAPARSAGAELETELRRSHDLRRVSSMMEYLARGGTSFVARPHGFLSSLDPADPGDPPRLHFVTEYVFAATLEDSLDPNSGLNVRSREANVPDFAHSMLQATDAVRYFATECEAVAKRMRLVRRVVRVASYAQDRGVQLRGGLSTGGLQVVSRPGLNQLVQTGSLPSNTEDDFYHFRAPADAVHSYLPADQIRGNKLFTPDFLNRNNPVTGVDIALDREIAENSEDGMRVVLTDFSRAVVGCSPLHHGIVVPNAVAESAETVELIDVRLSLHPFTQHWHAVSWSDDEPLPAGDEPVWLKHLLIDEIEEQPGQMRAITMEDMHGVDEHADYLLTRFVSHRKGVVGRLRESKTAAHSKLAAQLELSKDSAQVVLHPPSSVILAHADAPHLYEVTRQCIFAFNGDLHGLDGSDEHRNHWKTWVNNVSLQCSHLHCAPSLDQNDHERGRAC